MNKFDLLQKIHKSDVYKDEVTVVTYNSKGELTENIDIVVTYGKNGSRLAIIGKD